MISAVGNGPGYLLGGGGGAGAQGQPHRGINVLAEGWPGHQASSVQMFGSGRK